MTEESDDGSSRDDRDDGTPCRGSGLAAVLGIMVLPVLGLCFATCVIQDIDDEVRPGLGRALADAEKRGEIGSMARSEVLRHPREIGTTDFVDLQGDSGLLEAARPCRGFELFRCVGIAGIGSGLAAIDVYCRSHGRVHACSILPADDEERALVGRYHPRLELQGRGEVQVIVDHEGIHSRAWNEPILCSAVPVMDVAGILARKIVIELPNEQGPHRTRRKPLSVLDDPKDALVNVFTRFDSRRDATVAAAPAARAREFAEWKEKSDREAGS